MKPNHSDLIALALECEGLQSISHVYEALRPRYPTANAAELREVFLYCITELMRIGRLKFEGEGWVRVGEGEAAEFMFGDQPYGPDEAVVDGLRQPDDPSPEGVSRMMRARWPEQVKPAFNSNDDGFNSLWFEKWYFSWYDETGKSIVF